MHFSLVQYTSEEITPKNIMITSFSGVLESFLESKNYSNSIETLLIGIICVNPVFAQFAKARNKFTKSKKLLEYSIILDFESFRDASEVDARKILIKEILTSIDGIIASLKINGFDITAYKRDLEHFATEKQWI